MIGSSNLPKTDSTPSSSEPAGPGAPIASPLANPDPGVQGGWVALPSAAGRPGRVEELGGQGRANGPRIEQTGVARLDPNDLVEAIPHVVARGENFFSIAQQYYGSGRFYPALWKANSDQVPAPEKLVVGQTIRIPPPEALDRALILPPRTARGPGAEAAGTSQPARAGARPGSAAGRSSSVALTVPVADPFNEHDGEGSQAASGAIVAAPGPAAADRARLPRYRIRPQETLRSIARDVLGDSRRAGEILELNREVIDDPGHLIPGQEIDLPDDARLTRRVRDEP
jgi:nucleoid-associated protein YgaU